MCMTHHDVRCDNVGIFTEGLDEKDLGGKKGKEMLFKVAELAFL